MTLQCRHPKTVVPGRDPGTHCPIRSFGASLDALQRLQTPLDPGNTSRHDSGAWTSVGAGVT